MLRAAFLACLAVLLAPAVAGAAIFQERGGLASGTNGIAVGPDGNLWIAEAGNGTVARVTQSGQVLQRFPVGPSPTTVISGPGGRIWVAGTGSDRLVWIDATSPAPGTNFIATPGNCGPVGLAAPGNGRVYFSTPNDPLDATCTDPSRVGFVADDGSGAATSVPDRGKAFDLTVANGKLFVPDFGGTAVRRLALDDALTVESVVTVGGPNVDGITADAAGRIWATLFVAGDNLVSFPAGQNGGLASPVPTGLVNPFDIVLAGDGRLYVAGKDSAEVARIDPGTGAITRYGAPGAQPFQLALGTDGDLWVSDLGNSRVLRFVNGPPRATTGEARALATTAGSVGATVDPRGNATQVVFDYGTTTAYGSTTAPVTVPEGAGGVDVRTDLPDLRPGTTYHVRVRAANAEGEVSGADTVLTTPLPPPERLRATVSFRWRFSTAWTQLTRVLVRDLARTERIRVTCKGRGCGVQSRTVSARSKQVKLTRFFGRQRKLKPGAKVTVRITAPNAIGVQYQLTVRRKEPKVVRRCLRPGAKKPSRC